MTTRNLLLAFLLTLPATAAQAAFCNMGRMADACASPQAEHARLCQVVKEQFPPVDEDAYVHLGGPYYLVAVSNAATMASGFYQVNTDTRQMVQTTGYGAPTITASKMDGESCLVGLYRELLRHGRVDHGSAIAEIRTNPVTMTPYLVEMKLGALSKEEARALLCTGTRKIRPCRAARTFNAEWARSPRQLASPAALLDANKAALSRASKDRSPHELLEKAGVLRILDRKPEGLTTQQYVSILNNYAFFAYQQAGRSELAIEILAKVLRLAPDRVPAYLNMADALDYALAHREGEMPLDAASLKAWQDASAAHRRKYLELKQARRPSEPATE